MTEETFASVKNRERAVSAPSTVDATVNDPPAEQSQSKPSKGDKAPSSPEPSDEQPLANTADIPSPVPTTMPSSSQKEQPQRLPPHQPQIRHAGRALIRGKIRRVWRPRYLEVWDTGLVRYYEVPPSSQRATTTSGIDHSVHRSSTNDEANYIPGDAYYDDDNPGNQNHNTMMMMSSSDKLPKCTLWIHHARIIDVTTLRDMHVGLPRGSFGFLFHGHYRDSVDAQHHFQNYSPSQHYSKQMQLPTAAHSLIMPGQVCQGGEAVIPSPRDFLCAVETLEEAQMWVVALQWAANLGKSSSYQANWFPSSYPLFPATPTAFASSYDEEEQQKQKSPQQHDVSEPDHDDEEASIISTQQKVHQQQVARETLSSAAFSSSDELMSSTASSKESKVSTSKLEQLTSATKSEAAPVVTASAKMVVTRVTGYSLVRLRPWQWQVAYHIHVLLVVPSQHTVQEWSILRTAHDLTGLLQSLEEAKPTKKDAKWRKKLWQLVQNSPTLSGNNTNKSTTTTSAQEWNKAVQRVDVLLRALSMAATVVNAAAMKSFLGVTLVEQSEPRKSSSATAKSSFWSYHDPTALQTEPVSADIQSTAPDQFVKQWLKQQQQLAQHQTKRQTAQFWKVQFVAWLQHPRTLYGAAFLAASSVTILPLNKRWLRFMTSVMPHVSVRLDCLVLSWLVAAGVGRTWALREDDENRRRIADATGAKRSGVAAPTSSAASADARHLPKARTSTPHLENSRGGLAERVQARAVVSTISDTKLVVSGQETVDIVDENTTMEDDELDLEDELAGELLSEDEDKSTKEGALSSPLPIYNPDENVTTSCWSKPKDDIFRVRGPTYLTDRVKIPSGKASFTCLGVDMWLTDNPERNIARHPAVLGGKLAELTTKKQQDIFLVNFLLPFGNFVSYFSVPPLNEFATPQLAGVWSRFLKGDQQYRDARLKLLPVVVDGPWIVKAAVGPGTAPALLGKAIPLQYFFSESTVSQEGKKKEGGVYEVDVIITASTIAKGILSVVKGHTKAISIAFAFIIEAAKEQELPETVLCSFQVHSIHLEDCPHLPECNMDSTEEDDIMGLQLGRRN